MGTRFNPTPDEPAVSRLERRRFKADKLLNHPSLRAVLPAGLQPATADRRDQFQGITIVGDRIEASEGSGAIAGTSARVETAGEINTRLSASRLMMLGPLALFRERWTIVSCT